MFIILTKKNMIRKINYDSKKMIYDFPITGKSLIDVNEKNINENPKILNFMKERNKLKNLSSDACPTTQPSPVESEPYQQSFEGKVSPV